MVGQVQVNYQPTSREENELLEEIVRRTTETAQTEQISIELFIEERANTDDIEMSFGEVEVDYETRTGTIKIPDSSRKTLTPLAFKGLLYSLIGTVFGAYFFNNENPEKELFSKEKAPQREALFDYIMLHKGGTVEALVAYKVESTIRTMQMVARYSEEMEFNTGALAAYCTQLDQLQENLGTTIYCLATRQIKQRETYDA